MNSLKMLLLESMDLLLFFYNNQEKTEKNPVFLYLDSVLTTEKESETQQ